MRAKNTLSGIILLLCLLISTATAHENDEAVWENDIKQDGRVEAVLKLPRALLGRYDKNGSGHFEEDELVDEMIPIIDKHIWVEGDGKRGEPSLRLLSFGGVQVEHTVVGVVWTFPEKPKKQVFHYHYFEDPDDDKHDHEHAHDDNEHEHAHGHGESEEHDHEHNNLDGASQDRVEEGLTEEERGGSKCIARFSIQNGQTTTFVFTEREPTYELSALSQGFYGFFLIGIEHILFGFDHLLFVVVLMLAGGNSVQLLKMITAFTIAHSVTLALAVMDIFTLPGSIVEPIIAISIAVAAVENIRRDEPESRWKLAAGFGLIHGMGFAGVLADMQISGSGAMMPLLGFNLGVEAGQVALIFFALPFYYLVSRQDWNRKFRIAGSVLAGLVALYWTFGRIFG